MNLVVVGTGYVGLVTGACLASVGNNVTCVDIDQSKIDRLKRGLIPIHEPGLESIVKQNIREDRLHFTTSLAEAMSNATVYFIAVGTPARPDGSANLDYVLEVAREIGSNMNHYSVIVDKSTVPVGTADKVRSVVQHALSTRNMHVSFDVVSNPEFLREGAAVSDFMHPDRIIVGTDSDEAIRVMSQLYAPFNLHNARLLVMGSRDAEMSKYAANAMLATKISFINEIAGLCEKMGVDVENVRRGIGSDSRIGHSFISPGCGYGGSCFPKDVKALVYMAEENGFEPKVLNAVEARNIEQKRVLFDKISHHFGGTIEGLKVAVWGLSFKAGTDDMREASSIDLIGALINAGVHVRAYDPVAVDVARSYLPAVWFESGALELAEHQYDALTGADALALVTEWDPFHKPDFHLMQKIMKQLVIFDGRNIYNPDVVTEFGFQYRGIGREMNNSSLLEQFSISACA